MSVTREEAARLIPPPGGVTWRIAGDARLFAASGYALLLQVTHPSIGAGVTQHSDFKRDPWRRLLRTLDYTSSLIYGGPDRAWEMGRGVRAMHNRITGTRPDGERYHALERGPYAWVHATLAESIVRGRQFFCSPPPTPGEVDLFWAEWRRMGELIGVGSDDLPETWRGLVTYFDEMVERELTNTEAAQDVLSSLLDPTAPPLWWMRDGLWRVLRWPSARASHLATIGLLPPALRERLGVEWSGPSERRFLALARVARAASPLMPPQAKSFGRAYLRWRGEPV